MVSVEIPTIDSSMKWNQSLLDIIHTKNMSDPTNEQHFIGDFLYYRFAYLISNKESAIEMTEV